MITLNKRLSIILIAAFGMLLIPLITMQFTGQVHWSLGDFLVAGALLIGTGLICELVLRKVKTKGQRILLIAATLLILLVVWAELAVGIFGTPFAGS